MRKKKLFYSLSVAGVSLLTCVGVVYAASFTGEGTVPFDSIRIGQQDVGGVTFFNGTIINETTNESNADNPVTFGDNVRIDGRVYRGATAGAGDTMPFIVNDNMEVVGNLTPGGLLGASIVDSTNIADGEVAADDIAANAVTNSKMADNSVTGDEIVDGAITDSEIATNAVLTGHIQDGTITSADLANDSVTPDQINGTGGANLPIAYGFCDSAGTLDGGTSNVDCAWNASGYYEITIDNESYYFNEYVAIVTPTSDEYIFSTNSLDDNLTVYFDTHAGVTGQQSSFGFVVYKY
ncbi:MAG: hypothetical protein ABIB97_01705 [Patescibacteria group bacterium]